MKLRIFIFFLLFICCCTSGAAASFVVTHPDAAIYGEKITIVAEDPDSKYVCIRAFMFIDDVATGDSTGRYGAGELDLTLVVNKPGNNVSFLVVALPTTERISLEPGELLQDVYDKFTSYSRTVISLSILGT